MGRQKFDKKKWAAEFDRRMKAGYPRKYMAWGEYQIQDDVGNWFRRNGKGCCGCGRHRQAHDPFLYNAVPHLHDDNCGHKR